MYVSTSCLFDVVGAYECPVAVATVQVIVDHMVVTFLVGVEHTVTNFALLVGRVCGRARKVPLGAHMLPTCLVTAKACVAGIALVLGMVMLHRIAVLIASLPGGKAFDAISTPEHRAGNLIQRWLGYEYDGGEGAVS